MKNMDLFQGKKENAINKKMTNDFGYILREFDRGEQKRDNFQKDENIFNLVFHQILLKKVFKIVILWNPLKGAFGAKVSAESKTDIIQSYNPLYPLLAHIKYGRLKKILRKLKIQLKKIKIHQRNKNFW
ncbi:hypothetical protein TTHERM_00090330 (macronuclear) [Tetrahymena thermophila SB210]|uniref:Uncharacterized protein n=1 Tax=Tetrahymena thermophila (strain SB210) TaxID=312017 RepID=Q236G1_TETTS|nr:hypothetical protein TTHERM_00090330 [Tetrahymena thermophila SB210]EAR92539.2 hypothetical protein TTHERM_00090330 [Tetrahymena thermophila SB210]|eukprot:XP_001012784.2 hypothetical protein TTHERM_00090330 [Tetrahymena thermophila SB210]